MKKEKLVLENGNYTYLYKWTVSKPKGILHIVHGSIEHIGRYEPIIKYLNKQGISVYGMDLRGHGQSAFDQGIEGYFTGYEWINSDIKKVNEIIKKENPKTKITMYGHSMGSFALRYFLKTHKDFDAILSGTNEQSSVELNFGILVAKLTRTLKGKKKINHFIDNLSYKSFDKKMKNGESWLCNDPKEVTKYHEDKLNNFKFTNEAFECMLSWLKYIRKSDSYKNYNGRLLLIAGEKDPVGQMTKGPKKVFNKFKSNGANVDIKIIKGGHHEIHNGTSKGKVYKDISDFILNK